MTDNIDDPAVAIEDAEFNKVLSGCLSRLPPRLARAFTLQELHGTSTKAACEELNVSKTNYWVMLHRARVTLRKCLNALWINRQ